MKNNVIVICLILSLKAISQPASTNASKFNDLIFASYYQINFPENLNDMSRRVYCNIENDDYLNNIKDEFYIHDKSSIYNQEILNKSREVQKNRRNIFYYDFGAHDLANYDIRSQSFLLQIPTEEVPQLTNCSYGMVYFLKLNDIDKYYSIRVPKEEAKKLLTEENGKIKPAIVYVRYYISPEKKVKKQEIAGQQVYELRADLNKIELYKDEGYREKLGEIYIKR